LTELSGKEVKYTSVEIPAFEGIMAAKELPPFVVKKIVDFNTDIKNNQEAVVTHELEIKLCRKPTSLKEGLKILFNL
jgi:NAD(P)H dehydrogenase (quinone)